MQVGELTNKLNVFHHISGTDRVLIQTRDSASGTVVYYELVDIFKTTVLGRQLPVLVPGDDPVTLDVVAGKIRVFPFNGEESWLCSTCGCAVGCTDHFCKQCGERLAN